ncbi:MAG TPA: efflux RND transporter permease subunit [Gammaproteobacteria bacterium]|nr:efflux RND transporter permease subunit [Gammaproteobacteria bacterium]
MNITEFALKRPVTVMVVFTCFAAIGVIAARLLPLEYFPDIEFPFIQVQVPYQGSSPEEVERLITKPIEEALGTLSGVKRMTSTSDANQSEVDLEFNWDENVSVKEVQVLDKVDSIRGDLPADVRHIAVLKQSGADVPILQLRISSNRDLTRSYDMLNRLLKDRIQRVSGVSHVDLYGVVPQEIRIELHADAIAAHNVDLNKLNAILSASNFAVSAGNITDAGQRLLVQVNDEYKSLDDIRNLRIGEGNLRLGDIATITHANPELNYGRHLDRKYAIGIDVYKETGANMVEVAQRVMAEVNDVARMPEMQGVNIFPLGNQADGVKQSLSAVLDAGLMGAMFSLVVLYYFLRQFTTTLMVTLAVPFSLLIALAVMYFMGLSLNILSMMGLMLAIGMLVDNAVVVTESIFRHRQLHPGDPVQAAITGSRDVSLAVTAGTLSTIIVFLPNVFGVQNDLTVFLKHVAIAIVVSLAASLFISLTMMPMLSARIPAPKPPKRPHLVERLSARYAKLLGWSLTHRWIMIGVIFLVIVTSALPIALVKKDAGDSNPTRLFLEYNFNGHYSLEVVEDSVNQVESYLFAHQKQFEFKSIYTYYDTGRAETSILLRDDLKDRKSAPELEDEIRKDLPHLAIGQPSFDDQQSGGGIEMQVTGDSTSVLEERAQEITRILSRVKGVEDVRAETLAGTREVHIHVDRDRALRSGLDADSVASAVMVALRGEELPQYRGANGEINISLAYQKSDRETLEQLRNLQLYNAAGTAVRLDSVADFGVTEGPSSIQHVNREASLGITLSLAHDVTFDQVRPQIKQVMDSMNLPPGYQWAFGEGVQQDDSENQIMVTNMLLAVLLIYIVMAALFESLLHPAAILSGIVFSIFGVFWFFLVSGTNFGIMAMIGILILMGVVVNNGIVMIDHINQLRREGQSRYSSVVEGATHRLRPILMTMSTTILGLVPLAIGNTTIGGDGPPYFPMARAIIGGLAFSTPVSLLVLPTIYILLDDLGLWSARMMAAAREWRTARAHKGSVPNPHI